MAMLLGFIDRFDFRVFRVYLGFFLGFRVFRVYIFCLLGFVAVSGPSRVLGLEENEDF